MLFLNAYGTVLLFWRQFKLWRKIDKNMCFWDVIPAYGFGSVKHCIGTPYQQKTKTLESFKNITKTAESSSVAWLSSQVA